jgi:tripartite-type tricarboxylate transporter receptor subunit TctC
MKKYSIELNNPHVWTPSRRDLLIAGAAGLVAGSGSASESINKWPLDKPIKIIAAQAPGSSNDATARALADYFTQKLKVPVVVENRPGAISMIAAEAVARSAPDGHTLLMTLQSQLAQAPALLKKLPVNPDKDLAPIASLGVGPIVMAVSKDFPVNSLAELIAYAKKTPVNVGNYAIGSGWQMMLRQLSKDTGAQFNVANYKGTGAMLMDLYGGQVNVGAGSLSGMGGGLSNGQIRAILIIIGNRSPRLPGVPTWVDAGFRGPAYEDLAETNMLFAPAGTPQHIVDAFAKLVRESVDDSPKVKSVRDLLAADDKPLVGAELKTFIARSWPAYRRLTSELGISVE